MLTPKELVNHNSILLSMDIWNAEGELVAVKLNTPFQELTFNGDFDKVENILLEIKGYPFYNLVSEKVDVLLSQLYKLKKTLNFNDTNYKKVSLIPFKDKNKKFHQNLEDLENGIYLNFFSNHRFSNFTENFDGKSSEIIKILKSKNFDFQVSQHFAVKMRVMSNCRIHNFDEGFCTISDENHHYDRGNSARLASLTSSNFLHKDCNKTIENAFILPFEHTYLNYYHNLIECIFGLRYFDYHKYDYPIVYSKDKFNIIPFIAKKLNIDQDRFLSLDDVSTTLIKKAYCFHKGSFYWDKSIYDFARKLIPSSVTPSRKKVYLSRLKSRRPIQNELEVENFLRCLNFEIVYSEDLNFEQQCNLFSEIEYLVAPHGAGLANICFMPEGATLVEIFEKGMIKADFYLRSTHNKLKYDFLFLDDNKNLDLKSLNEIISNK
ncbi:Protein of unknown function [Acinetobacter marinus]|uniref:Glycosyltransferase 61 catalytic domain-containing protein n=2 Tax=Acinetobacter marinus TaxID=281375 RepID=A0A1G6L0L3_9GAMM|nr:Protein of unknown function [Acinetobacter marinus]